MDPNPESQLAWEQLLWEPRHRKDGGVTSQGQTGKLSRFLGVRQDWEGGGAGLPGRPRGGAGQDVLRARKAAQQVQANSQKLPCDLQVHLWCV